MGSTDETLVLKWNNHLSTFAARLSDLRYEEACSDVTLTCDGAIFLAHKFVLSTCSDYLSRILALHPNKHQVLFLSTVPKLVMEDLLDFMYNGNISIPESRLTALLTVAEQLQIKGLVAAKQLHSANANKGLVKAKQLHNANSNHRPSVATKRKPEENISNSSKKTFFDNISLASTPKIAINNSKDMISPAQKVNVVPIKALDFLKKKVNKISPKEQEPIKSNKLDDKVSSEDGSYLLHNSIVENIKKEANDISSKDDSSDRSTSPVIFNSLSEDGKEDSNIFSQIDTSLHKKLTVTSPSKLNLSVDVDAKKENHCDICDKSFTVKSNLQRHIDTHHKNIKYSCELCDKTFTRKDRLKVHQKIHNDSYRFLENIGMCDDDNEQSNEDANFEFEGLVCHICQIRFENSKGLKNHLKIHEDSSFPCDECDTVFKHLKNLKRHKKNHHMSLS